VLSIVSTMNLIDWRELYASNRAAIAAAGVPDPHGSGVTPLPAPLVTETAVDPGWERLEYDAGDRARPFHLYTPPALATGVAAPLVVLLHGCTQTPTGFAAAAAMPRLADRHGFLVLCPEQSRSDNQQACWNWFLPAHQARGAGEPAFIAGAARQVLAERSADAEQVFVAGLSAGGAMATVMAATHPDLFAAAAVHSGLAYRAAANLGEAFQAMTRGATDPGALGRAAYAAMGDAARAVPTLVVHGSADGTVAPANGEQVVRQWLEANRLAEPDRCRTVFERPSETLPGHVDGGHAWARRRWLDDDGRPVGEFLEVAGLGHAWSGGTDGAAFADPRGPAASEAMWAFFSEVARYSRPATRAT
jgi:poly(hydroxyalkanoate) depolymerase family esterase